MSYDQRVAVLDEALLQAIPESRDWPRSLTPLFPFEHERRSYIIEAPLDSGLADRRLRIELGPDGDLQVDYYLENHRGSPFEFLFPIPEGEEASAMAQGVEVVAGLFTERLAVAMEGNWRGGRTLVETAEMTGMDRRRYLWVSSLRGTYDWREKPR